MHMLGLRSLRILQRSKILALLAVGSLLGLVGCGVDGTGQTGGTGGTGASTVTIILSNQTDFQLDPHLFISSDNLTAEQLFAGNTFAYRAFNLTGQIDANDQVLFTLPCSQVVSIGSDDAGFSDLATFTGGTSVDSPIIFSGDNFTCGQSLTFTFSRDQADQFHTAVMVSN